VSHAGPKCLVAEVSGNPHSISISKCCPDALTLGRCTCGHAAQWPTLPRFYAAAAAADTALGNM